MIGLVDGDVICYRSGFASDAAAKGRGLEHEPLANCLHGVKQSLDAIANATGSTRQVIYLSHPVNRREHIFPAYKQNRDITHKPYWYSEIKEYLLERRGALFSEQGDEADDALGMEQVRLNKRGKESIICTIDKDLDVIPGLHYNFSKNRVENGVYELQDPECLRLFYQQMITGDAADNIPGLYATLGKKATKEIKAPLQDMFFESEMYRYVLELYQGNEDHVNLLAQLLWIRRDERFWEPPSI